MHELTFFANLSFWRFFNFFEKRNHFEACGEIEFYACVLSFPTLEHCGFMYSGFVQNRKS